MEEKETCRVCLKLKRNRRRKCISVFEKHGDTPISESIISIANVQIEQGDGLPSKICQDCLSELNKAISFRLKCESSDTFLRNSLLLSNTSIESESTTQIEIKKEEPIESEAEEYLDEGYMVDRNNYFENVYDQLVNKTELKDYKEENIGDENNQDTVIKQDTEIEQDIVPLVKKSKAIDMKLECHDCGELFKSKCKLRVHWKQVHMYDNLICQLCKRTFKSFKAFHRHAKLQQSACKTAAKVHVEGIGRSRVFHCKHCSYNSKRVKDIQTHLLIHTGDKPFMCDICSSSFTQQSSLEAHRESHHRMYKAETTCQYCGKILKGRARIYRHLKLHTSKQHVQCDICKKLLKSKDALVGHIQRHSGIKLFTCEKCAKSFYTLSELCNHRRQVHNKHNHIKICDMCGYKTSRTETIRQHQKKHAMFKEYYPCNVCGAFLEDAETLDVHRRKHFAERKYECPQCDKRFLNKKGLGHHIRKQHQCRFLINKSVNEASKESLTPLSRNKKLLKDEISPLPKP